MAINSELAGDKEPYDFLFKPNIILTDAEMETEENRTNMLTTNTVIIDKETERRSSCCKSCKNKTQIGTTILIVFNVLLILFVIFYMFPPYTTSNNQYTNVSKENGREPVMLLYVDQTKLKYEIEKKNATNYSIIWSNGFSQGNIFFNGSRIYINESGIYNISVCISILAGVKKTKTKSTRFHIVLRNSTRHSVTKKVCHIPLLSGPFYFAMSLNHGLQLEANQSLYVDVSPASFMDTENSSSFFIYKMK